MINYAVHKAMGNSSGIQAGSAFKPFVVAAALDQGMDPDLRIESPDEIDMSGKWFDACWNDQTRVRDLDYEPRNSTRGGDITMRKATEYSTNTYFVQLLQRTGICEPAQIAERSGVWKQVPSTTEPQPLDQVPSFALGSNTVAPLGMARRTPCSPTGASTASRSPSSRCWTVTATLSSSGSPRVSAFSTAMSLTTSTTCSPA